MPMSTRISSIKSNDYVFKPPKNKGNKYEKI